MRRPKHLLLPLILCALFLPACGGGSGGVVDPVDSEKLVDPPTIYSLDGDVFKPYQVVIVNSDMPFIAGEQIEGRLSSGELLTITGLKDGRGTFQVPGDSEPGGQEFSFVRNGSAYNMEFQIEEVLLPQNAEVYLADIIDRLKGDIREQLNDSAVEEDTNLTQLLDDLNKIDLSQESEQVVANLAFSLFVNAGDFFNDVEPSVTSGYSITRSSESECTAAKALFLYMVVSNAAIIGLMPAAVTGIAIPVLIGSLTITITGLSESVEQLNKKCTGNVIGIIAKEFGPEPSVRNEAAFPRAAIAAPQQVSFYDGDSKKLEIIFTKSPIDEVKSKITKLLSNIDFLSEYFPSSWINKLDQLVKNYDVNETGSLAINSLSNGGVNCSGSVGDLMCEFVDDGRFHDELVNFNIFLSHPDYPNDQFIVGAQVLPRDTPAINEQSFTVVSGERNLIHVVVVEDINSPNYEKIKVTDFEVVSHPQHGYFATNIDRAGNVEYFIDSGDNVPSETAFSVRASNRYGWSGTASIKLMINDSCGEVGQGFPSSYLLRYFLDGKFYQEDYGRYLADNTWSIDWVHYADGNTEESDHTGSWRFDCSAKEIVLHFDQYGSLEYRFLVIENNTNYMKGYCVGACYGEFDMELVKQ